MTLSHLHLIMNHVPTVGSAIALGLLLLALFRRSEHLKHAGLEILFVIAVVTLPVYITGVGAQREIRDRPEVSDAAMMAHQDVALAGFTVVELAGFAAWMALWQTRRSGRASSGMVAAAMLLTAVSLAIMARAATLGGEIRHPEIQIETAANGDDPVVGRAASPALSVAQDGAASAASGPAPSPVAGSADDKNQYVAGVISTYMVNSTWIWPAGETIHFLGFSLSIGVLLAVNLRILGAMRHVPFADVHRLLPWGMLGFGVNLMTGMLFFIGQPGQYIESAPFYWKVVFLMIAGANFLYLTVFSRGWTADRLDSSLFDKAMAVTSIFSWLAVLYAGRMLPFLGIAF